MNEMQDKYIRFDWAIKRLLRQKANFDVLEGFLTVFIGERITIVELLESEVSLSEEDREALLGAITQRPVSKVLNLSPTVHLTAYVRSEPDLYQLKNMIEQVLEEEICACAEGEHL